MGLTSRLSRYYYLHKIYLAKKNKSNDGKCTKNGVIGPYITIIFISLLPLVYKMLKMPVATIVGERADHTTYKSRSYLYMSSYNLTAVMTRPWRLELAKVSQSTDGNAAATPTNSEWCSELA